MSTKLTVWFRDSYGRETKRTFGLVTTDPGQAETDALSFISQLKGNLFVQPVRAYLKSQLDFEVGSPVAGSNIDEAVTIRCWTAGFKRQSVLNLPCPDATWRRTDGTANLTAFGVIRPVLQAFYEGTGTMTLDDGKTVPVGGWIDGAIDM